MNGAKTFTQLLMPLLIGFILGGAISGNSTLLIISVFLMVLDIIVGVTLQYAIDNDASRGNFENLTRHMYSTASKDTRNEDFNQGNRLSGNSAKHSTKTQAEHSICEQFEDVYLEIEDNGGTRGASYASGDEASALLLEVCMRMPHAPLPYTIAGLYAVSSENLDGEHALAFSFIFSQNSICQNVYIYLVHTKNDKIRLFAVETDYSKFVLCEYSGYSHINYGDVQLNDIPNEIKRILNSN